MSRKTRLTTALTLTLVLVLVSACVGRDSPFSLFNLLRRGGALTPTPTLPVPPLIVTATPGIPQPQVLTTTTLEAGAQADAVVNADSNVNLRQGPGTNYPVVGTVSPGAELTVLGRNADSSWFRIETAAGQQAWIWGSLITLSIDAASVPVAEAPPPPAGGGQTAGGGAPAGTPGGPLQFSWTILGIPRDDPNTNTSFHTIVITAQGGSGVYTYYRDGQQLSSSQFVLAWVTCGGQVVTTIRVDSSDGQSVEQVVGFNSFCPTPFGCNPAATECNEWVP